MVVVAINHRDVVDREGVEQGPDAVAAERLACSAHTATGSTSWQTISHCRSPPAVEWCVSMVKTHLPWVCLVLVFVDGTKADFITIIRLGKLALALYYGLRWQHLSWEGNRSWTHILNYYFVVQAVHLLWNVPLLHDFSIVVMVLLFAQKLHYDHFSHIFELRRLMDMEQRALVRKKCVVGDNGELRRVDEARRTEEEREAARDAVLQQTNKELSGEERRSAEHAAAFYAGAGA
eukprot:gene466-56738_t